MVSQAELILRVITLWFLVLSQFFRDGMGPFKHVHSVGMKLSGNRLIEALGQLDKFLLYMYIQYSLF